MGHVLIFTPDLYSHGVCAPNESVENTWEPAGQGVDIDMRQVCGVWKNSWHSGFGADVCMWSEIVPDCVQGGSLEWLQLLQKDELGSLEDPIT